MIEDTTTLVAKLLQQQRDLCAWCGSSLRNGFSTERLKKLVLVCAVCFRDHHPPEELFRPYRKPAAKKGAKIVQDE